jgi:quinol monooxygenase YgiN
MTLRSPPSGNLQDFSAGMSQTRALSRLDHGGARHRPRRRSIEEIAMSDIASLIILRAKSGRRDELRGVWEKYARTYIAGSRLTFYYCYDDADPDRIIVFGLGDQASNQEFAQQPWFADYQRETQALLSEPSEIRSLTPQFIKAGAGSS